MPLPQLPYKRPFFQITLAAHEIEVRFDRRSAVQHVPVCLQVLSPPHLAAGGSGCDYHKHEAAATGIAAGQH